jgi:hypothetical protein
MTRAKETNVIRMYVKGKEKVSQVEGGHVAFWPYESRSVCKLWQRERH